MNPSRGKATPLLLDKSVDSLQRGLEAQRKNRSHDAKLHYLRAAELLFKAADLFVLPSDREGHSLAIMEAMAAALPITNGRHF